MLAVKTDANVIIEVAVLRVKGLFLIGSKVNIVILVKKKLVLQAQKAKHLKFHFYLYFIIMGLYSR